jgi:hypothetical protein
MAAFRRRSYLFLMTLAIGAGCKSQLETGYQPKPLDMPISQRETLYADPYSEHAMQAQQEPGGGGGGESQFHRPGSP